VDLSDLPLADASLAIADGIAYHLHAGSKWSPKVKRGLRAKARDHRALSPSWDTRRRLRRVSGVCAKMR